MAPLRQIDADLWVAESPLRFVVEMGRRMSVVRLDGDRLLLHSPVDLTDEVRRELAQLGQVSYIVAASKLHGNSSMAGCADAFPRAKLFAPPGLEEKRSNLRFEGTLGDAPDRAWAAELDQAVFRGHRMLDEVVFLHRSSRSLIVGDICFNVRPHHPLSTRLWAWGPGLRPRTGPALPFRLAVRDRCAARESIDRILEWDFDRIVVGHGDIIETGGHEALRSAWSWLDD